MTVRILRAAICGTRAFGTKQAKPPQARPAARQSAASQPRRPPPARKVVCVASCKGGVGKSSVSLNLAAALAAKGQRVGVLDVDIYGPSLPEMVPPLDGPVTATKEGLINPKTWGPGLKYPLQLMSYGYLRPGQYAAVRGPIVSGFVQQFLTGINWQDLDTLVIDMPPGTGDVQLTVSQHISVDAAVMVTTPQKLALVDVEKGIKMFDAVGIPTVAIVENMSYLDCGSCGTRTKIFGEGGGKRLAEQFGILNFHQFPLDPDFNSSSATASFGPMVMNSDLADRAIVKAVHHFATEMDAELTTFAAMQGLRPSAEISDDGAFISFSEGGQPPVKVPARSVRLSCRSAKSVNEWTGEQILKPEHVPLDIKALKIGTAGRYATHIDWSDGHDSLIPFAVLKKLSMQAGS